MRGKDKDPRMAFGKTVRTLRTAAGISQERLADLADINRSYIGDVERGKRNISLVNMTKVAAALSVPLSRVIAQMEKADESS